ncbi:MAG: hypothetical protein JWL97_2979 [Gemmatimonadales bacterium]|nr:hypothetical protein [Gemmatimonadales bacterium]
MPTVPRSTLPGVAPEATPGVRLPTQVNPDAVGTSSGIDTRGAQRAAQDIYERATEHANQVALLDADSNLSALETKVLYDPHTGALNMRGKNAAGAPEAVQEQWTKGVSDIEGSLSSDVQRMAFRRAVDQRAATLNETVARHVDTETKVYDDQTTQSYVNNERTAALANYQDPKRIQLAVDRQRAAIGLYATRNGLSDERKQELLTDVGSKTQVGVIGRMLANKLDLDARSYYETVKDQISGEDAPQLEKALHEGSVRGESQRQADAITAKAGVTLSDARAEWLKIKDPEVRDATEDRVRKFFSEEAENQRLVREQSMTLAGNILDRTHDVHNIAPTLWNSFSVGEKSSLMEYQEKLAKGIPVQTNWTAYYDLMSRASTPATRNGFIQESLMGYRAQLGDAEFKQLVDLQKDLRQKDATAEGKLGGIRTRMQVVDDGIRTAGLHRVLDDNAIALFRRRVDEEADQMEQRTGKLPSAVDVQGIVDNLLVQGVTKGGPFNWFDTSKRQYERSADEKAPFVINASDIPPGERVKIESSLRAARQPVNDATVLRVYQQKQQRSVRFAPQ